MNKIDFGLLLCGEPIEIIKGLKLYQPKVRDVVYIGEERYNLLSKLWTLDRKDLVIEETDFTRTLDDAQIWSEYIMGVEEMKEALLESSLIFFHKKIEFFPLSHTMYIGEGENGFLLDLKLYTVLKDLFSKLNDTRLSSDDDKPQFKETKNMSKIERRMLEKMRKSQEKLDKIKNGDLDSANIFGEQIAALTAIGHYTYSQVYDMTLLQFRSLVKKHFDIEQYQIRMLLSPYISSKDDNQELKHWLM